MTQFRIAVTLSHLIPENAPLSSATFPALSLAVKSIVEAAHQQWSTYAQGRAALPNGKTIASRSGEYARSIQVRQTGDFAGEVYSDLAYAKVIEEGAAGRDMKEMLRSSLKVRLTADGRRYLIIPFRHNHPNAVMGHTMPESVWNWWKHDKIPSSIRQRTSRESGTGVFDIDTRRALRVAAWKYKWGTTLGKSDLEGMGLSAGAVRKFAGMVNFRKPGASGGASHSKYMTFRVMMEGSPGWVRGPTAGYWPARTVSETLGPVAEEAFRAAVEEDIARIVAGG
jgi:hypothetical protein